MLRLEAGVVTERPGKVFVDHVRHVAAVVGDQHAVGGEELDVVLTAAARLLF